MIAFLNSSVEIVELTDKQVVFHSNRRFAEGKRVTVKATLGDSGQTSTLDVEVVSGRPAQQGGMLYSGVVYSDTPTAQIPGGAQRASRHSLGVRVMSRNLPGYKGFTIDMSRTGLQLEADGPVEPHTVLELNMEFDRVDLNNLICHAEVTWCRPAPNPDRYRLGLRFAPATPEEQRSIEAVADFFEQRSHADLHSLLEEAKLLPKDLKRAAPPPAPAVPSTAPAPAPRRGLRLPLEAVVQGYLFDHEQRSLTLVVRAADGMDHRLEFPDCQTLRDYACCLGETARYLEVCPESELLHQAVQRHPGPWKHYRVVDSQAEPLLELISGQMEMPGA